MLLSAVSVLVVEQSSSEVPEGLMNNPVLQFLVALPIPKITAQKPSFYEYNCLKHVSVAATEFKSLS
jgi:hypothetical protein